MAHVVSVSISQEHTFSKYPVDAILLIQGEGIEGDAHRGSTVQHRSRVKIDPSQPNLRQVHLIHNELLEGLREQGFDVVPASLGENITTSGLDLLHLSQDTLLKFPSGAQIQVTGLRNPCAQLDRYQKGLTAAVLDRDAEGHLIRKSGIMGIVHVGGYIYPNDTIEVCLPPEPHRALERV